MFTTGDEYAITANFKTKLNSLINTNGDCLTLRDLKLLLQEPIDNSAIEWKLNSDVTEFANFNDFMTYKLKKRLF